jgi:hypothetical protein
MKSSEKFEDYKLIPIENLDTLMKEIEAEQSTLKWKLSAFFYKVYDLLISPRNWYNRFKWFFQRRIRGFDDRELWSLEDTFYNWLLPRLESFLIVNTHSYPERYKTYENWHKEIKERIKQLKLIIDYHYDEQDFPYPSSYLPQDRIDQINSDVDEERIRFNMNIEGYTACRVNFLVWFANNIPDLWD